MTKSYRIPSLLLACIACYHTALSENQHSPFENVTLEPAFTRIPEPHQSFRTIRTSEENYVFVDKTNYIRELIDNDQIVTDEKIYFLVRPRSFGKTFFLSMVDEFLNGSKELFENTAIYARGNTIEGNGGWKQHPVISIDFSSFAMNTVEGFENDLNRRLGMIANTYSVGIDRSNEDTEIVIWLIRKLKLKFNSPVSVLIDEFDCPGLDISPRHIREGIIRILVSFYDEIRFAAVRSELGLWLVLILGISKLYVVHNAMMSMERDITFEDKFSSIIGFSADEVEKNFKPHLDKLAEKNMWSISDAMQKIENLYGGYHFTTEKGAAALLNAGSVSFCLRTFEFADFETETQTRTLNGIIYQMEDEGKGIDHFKYVCTNKNKLDDKFDTVSKNKIIEVPLYLQMLWNGYLTIKLYRRKTHDVCFSYPNEGIRNRIERLLLPNFRSNRQAMSDDLPLRQLMLKALRDCDIQRFVELMIKAAFPEISMKLMLMNTVPRNKEASDAISDIFRTLHILRIDCKEGLEMHSTKNGNVCGNLHLIIFSSEENIPHYVIQIKFATHPSNAVFQLFDYVVNTNIEFERAFRIDDHPKTDIINLLGLVTTRHKDRRRTISDWILVPPYSTKDKKIKINEAKASQPGILSSLSKHLKDQPYFEQNEDYFVL